MPASVPQPTGAPDTALSHEASTASSSGRCGCGCAPIAVSGRQPHRPLKDCQGPFVQTRSWWAGSFDHNGVHRVVLLKELRGSSARLLPQPQCSLGRNLSIHKETALGTSLATVRRVGPNQVPPKRALPMAPSAACHSRPRHAKLFAPLHQGSPHSVQDARPTDRRKVRVTTWCCRPQAL